MSVNSLLNFLLYSMDIQILEDLKAILRKDQSDNVVNSGLFSIAAHKLNYIQSTSHTEFETPSDEHIRQVVCTTLGESPTTSMTDGKHWYFQFFS